MFSSTYQYQHINLENSPAKMAQQIPLQGSPDADHFEEQDLTSIPNLGESTSAVIGGDDTGYTMYGSHPGGMNMPSGVPAQRSLDASRVPRSSTAPAATTNVPLSPQTNGNMRGGAAHMDRNATKLDALKTWSKSTFMCTRQILSEKLGKGTKTVDVGLEAQIEQLRDTQKKYSNILRLSRAMTSHLFHVVQSQRSLGETFTELAQKSPELQDEFSYNAETQRTLVKNGEILLTALNFFTSSINTLINKTMEDTLQTIKQYETARLEYDAYRTDLESMQAGPKTDPAFGVKLDEMTRLYNSHKEKFDRLRADVDVKLRFLEENKVKVMHKQLLLFHKAISAYFAGNAQGLEQTIQQFSIKLKMPNSSPPSWLEDGKE